MTIMLKETCHIAPIPSLVRRYISSISTKVLFCLCLLTKDCHEG